MEQADFEASYMDEQVFGSECSCRLAVNVPPTQPISKTKQAEVDTIRGSVDALHQKYGSIEITKKMDRSARICNSGILQSCNPNRFLRLSSDSRKEVIACDIRNGFTKRQVHFHIAFTFTGEKQHSLPTHR